MPSARKWGAAIRSKMGKYCFEHTFTISACEAQLKFRTLPEELR